MPIVVSNCKTKLGKESLIDLMWQCLKLDYVNNSMGSVKGQSKYSPKEKRHSDNLCDVELYRRHKNVYKQYVINGNYKTG